MSGLNLAPRTSAGSPWAKVAGVVIALATLLVVLLTAFGLPTLHTSPRDVPIVVVGPEAAVAPVTAGLDAAAPGAFDVTSAATTDEADALIRERTAYGALVVGPDGVTVRTASAASAMVATTLTTIGQQLATTSGAQATVVDVVPFTTDDPRGVGLTAGALPIALGGLPAGVGCLTFLRGDRQRLVGAAAFAVVGGAALTAVLQFWFGTFEGSYALTSLAAALGIGATAMLVLGLERALGAPGIGVATLLVVLLGNPLSGLASAPEMLPQPWGTIGQLLPPGATGTLLRNVAFFDGASTAQPVLVLACYVALGLGLYALGARRTPREQVAASGEAQAAQAAV